MIAAGVMSVLLVGSADSMPVTQCITTITQDSDVTLVRDGCGRGMRYSERRGRCVEQRDADPIRPFIRELVRPIGCSPGYRWSERRERCVPNY